MHRNLRLVTAATILALTAAPAMGAVMGAEEFYQRATKLKKKGALAVFARGEIKRLVNEVKVAGEKVKSTRLSAEAAGKKGRYCPPQPPRQMGTEEYLKGLSAIPAAERARIDLVEATTRILEKKYPCKG